MGDARMLAPVRRDGAAGCHGPDHRLRIYRADSGDLMCLAHAGALSSETRITAAVCGTDLGCRGIWRCLEAVRTVLISKN